MKKQEDFAKTPLFQQRLKKALWVAWLLQLAPFVRMIGLNGSMTRGEMRKESDIDFLIIAKQGRIWTTRFFVTILTHLTGHRRYKNKVAGRICLNRYQTDQFLEIKPHDFYHARTFSSLVPLYDQNLYPKYQKENKWMEGLNFKVQPTFKIKLANSSLLGFLQKIQEMILSGFIGNWLEKNLRSYQRERILRDKRTIEAPKGRIRISDWEICLHPKKEGEM